MDTDDESAIRRLIDRYFSAADRQDRDAYCACFTDDATLTTLARPDGGGGTAHEGIEAVMAAFRTVETFAASCHVAANVVVDVHGESASADTIAVAFVVAKESDGTVATRGLRYRDDLVRHDGGWRIRRRVHSALWQFNSPASPVALSSSAERLLAGDVTPNRSPS
jgi:uncharacterized protein (TIGR02246 family)